MNNKYQDEDLEFIWPSHSDSLIDSIYETMTKECFTDATLVCMDSSELKSLKVHKVILAACSPILAKLFEENKENHPLEFEGIQYKDLKCVIDFMYAGQTVVPIDRKQHFLSIAKCFRIEVLCNKTSEEEKVVGEDLSPKQQEPILISGIDDVDAESIRGNERKHVKQLEDEEQSVIIDEESKNESLDEEIKNGDKNSAYTNFIPVSNDELISLEKEQNKRTTRTCICSFRTEDASRFNQHQISCLYCYMCKIFFKTKPSYKKHFQVHHPSTPMFMGKIESSKMQRDRMIQQKGCPGYGCNSGFATAELLEAHVQKCHRFLIKALSEGQQTYKYWCLNCLMKFDDEANRKYHSEVCDGIHCTICKKSLSKPEYLRAHILFTHKEHTFDYNLLKCKICQIKTQSKADFSLNFYRCNKISNHPGET